MEEKASVGLNSSRVYQIGGIPVEFPYKAYGSQLAYMGKVIAALEKSSQRRQSQEAAAAPSSACHALLESPTGTGKSLALLCATLAWQKHYKATAASRPPQPPLPPDVPDPATPDVAPTIASDSTFAMGGGFLPENPSSASEFVPVRPRPGRGGKAAEKKSKVPTIFYATRTHSQITQIVKEYRKTSYRVPMGILAARKHYCTNKQVCKKKNVDEECKTLLRDSERSCLQFKNVLKVRSHPSLRKGGANEIHDIEDLVKIGHSVKGCSYFAAWLIADDAQIVFCPYIYILNPVIRRGMEINLQGAVVILDEAHNIEDVARESGSIDLEMEVLEVMGTELEQLVILQSTCDFYHPLQEMVQEMLCWIRHQTPNLEKHDFEQYCSSWNGVRALQELQSAGVTLQSFPVLMKCALKAIAAAADPESKTSHLTGLSATALEGLFSALSFMLGNGGQHAGDYRLVLRKYVKRDEGVANWTCSLSLWCLDPAVVFREIACKSLSVILTSGTLSPMDSFASELGVPFEICMEAPHVIDMEKQVWAASVLLGPGNVPLNASYKHADGYAFQDALGIALEEYFKVSPDGALIFFPSYKLLEKLCSRWKSTGQWARLAAEKQLFVEPRGNQENFEKILAAFYNCINRVENIHKENGKTKSVPKKNYKATASQQCANKRPFNGAAFFAVCRGKVSEGIDFSDKYARLVIVVGIPFPNKKDLQVSLKKQYNSENRFARKLLSGDKWYCNQAFRALNQAVGRCIRHRHDYGAVILLDERYGKSNYLDYISKWLRNSIQRLDSFEQSVEGLKHFHTTLKASASKCATIGATNPVLANERTTIQGLKLTDWLSTSSAPGYGNIGSQSSLKRSALQETNGRERKTLFDDVGNTESIAPKSQDYEGCAEVASKPIISGKLDSSPLTMVSSCTFQANSCKNPCPSDARFSLGSGSSLNPSVSASCSKHEFGYEYPKKTLAARLQVSPGIATELFPSDNANQYGSPVNVENGFHRTETFCHLPSIDVRKLDVNIGSTVIDNESTRRDSSSNHGKDTEFNSCLMKHAYVSNKLPEKTTPYLNTREKLEVNVGSTVIDNEATTRDSSSNRRISCMTKYVNYSDKLPKKTMPYPSIRENLEVKLGSTIIDNESARDSCTSHEKDTELNSCMMEYVNCSDKLPEKTMPYPNMRENIEAKLGSTIINDQTTWDSYSSHQKDTELNTCMMKYANGSNNLPEKTETFAEDNMESHILSCSQCGNLLGNSERDMHVAFYRSTLRKTYLEALLHWNDGDNIDHTQLLVTTLESLHKTLWCPNTSICSISKDRKAAQLNPIQAVWVEEDGCVFKPIFCQWCTELRFCIGAHVLAADVENTPFVAKALLFAGAVKVSNETAETISKAADFRASREFENHMDHSQHGAEALSCVKRSKETLTRPKLKLPRRSLAE